MKNVIVLIFVCMCGMGLLRHNNVFANGVYYDYSTDPNLGDHCFVWDQWPGWSTYNDWKKVGTTGYDNYYSLATDVNITDDMVPRDPTPSDAIRYLNWLTPTQVAPPTGTMAGYEWSVPQSGPGSDQVIVGFKMPGGTWGFEPGANAPAIFELTDDRGHILWSYLCNAAVPAWIPVQTAHFPQYGDIKTIRLVMKTIGTPHWAWAGHYATEGFIQLYTVDEPTEPFENHYSEASTDPNLGDHTFTWNQWPQWSTYNDWTKVGSSGYESYWDLTTDVDISDNNVPHSPDPNDNVKYLYWSTPTQVAPPTGTWAGYEWSVPETGPGSDQVIVGFTMPGGTWHFDIGALAPAEFELTDDQGNVLWDFTGSAAPQWISNQTVYFGEEYTDIKTVRLVMKTVNDPHWAWAGNYAWLSQINLYTVTPHNGPYYGFYHTATEFGNLISEVNEFSNINHLFFDANMADSFIANGSKLLIDTTWQFWNGNPGLNPDYQNQWNLLKTLITPYYKEHIAGFYVMDEPEIMPHGLTPAELEVAVATIKADFPDIPVMTCYAGSSLSGFDSNSIPANLDWVAFDAYGDFNNISNMLDMLKMQKYPYQKIFLVPQGYTWGGQNSDQQVANWSYGYNDLFLSDPEIIGQLVYLCHGAPDTNLPLTYASQQNIGGTIVRASVPNPANSTTNVSLTPTLSWIAAAKTVSHDVYFGTSFSDVNTATHASGQYKGNQTGTTYVVGILAAKTTYYWRIDEINASGVRKGRVWSFTTDFYTEKFQDITIGTASAWTDVDLSSYGVGANQVVEIGIRNSSTSTARDAGVRTKGSSLARKIVLHAATMAGWDMTTMMVKTDANKKIQAYAASTSDVHFYLVGIWNSGDYTEKYQALTIGTTGSWVDSADLSTYGVGSNQVVEVMASKKSTTAYIAGIRGNGSTLDRKLTLHASTSSAADCLVMQAQADASKKIEVWKGNTSVTFTLLGYWTTAPGTYTEKFVDVGKPSSNATWTSRSLSGQGVPAYAICEMLMANASTSNNNNLGVRKVSSSLSRLFDIHKSSASAARECGMMHVETDSSSNIQQYLQNSSDTVNFYLLGYWN